MILDDRVRGRLQWSEFAMDFFLDRSVNTGFPEERLRSSREGPKVEEIITNRTNHPEPEIDMKWRF